MLSNIVIKGVYGIEKVFMREEQKNTYSEQTEWILDTQGINLLETLGIPGVDHKRTTTNSVIETLQTLGIEAARQTLLKELTQVNIFLLKINVIKLLYNRYSHLMAHMLTIDI